jgi:hypothetical protein
MIVSRAGKQMKAYWRSQEHWREKWEAEKSVLDDEKAYGQYQITNQRLQGHAAGWIAGVAWAKRNLTARTPSRKESTGKRRRRAG